jgi:ATP-dependent DNA ligase
MDLPVMPPVEPMLAKSIPDIPERPGLYYEPKWDGFRCIVFRDGDEVELGSRGRKFLTRYFPEVVEAAKARLPERCVVDGEIVIVRPDDHDERPGSLAWDTLTQRIHPAASRVNLLAEQTPASFIAFDLLALGDDNLCETPYAERRAALERVLDHVQPPVHMTPATTDPAEAKRWFEVFEGAGLDGLICKDGHIAYEQNKRLMFKVKHARTVDVVVAGFRWHKSGPVVGSLLLGLYNADGKLQHIGVSASFSVERRKELLDELAPYRDNALEGHPWREWAVESAHEADRMPGAVSRWNSGKDLSWVAIRPELVAEVAYDHMEGDRFRHTTRLLRWRPDREPSSCTYEQLDRPVRFDLAEVLAGRP